MKVTVIKEQNVDYKFLFYRKKYNVHLKLDFNVDCDNIIQPLFQECRKKTRTRKSIFNKKAYDFTVILNDNLSDKLYISMKDKLTPEDITLIILLTKYEPIVDYKMGL